MTHEEMKAFESWLLRAYQENPNVPFAVISSALKLVRASVR